MSQENQEGEFPENEEEMESASSGKKNIPSKPGKVTEATDMAKDIKDKGVKGAITKKATDTLASKAPQQVKDAMDKGADIASKAAAVQSAVTATQGFLAKVGSVLVNPVAWIVIAVLLGGFLQTLAIVSGLQVVGSNDNAKGCVDMKGGQSSSSSVTVQDSGDWLGTAQQVATWLMSTDFDRFGGPLTFAQTAGVIGNWAHESGGMNPAATQAGFASENASNEEILALGNKGGRAVGLAQWDSERRTGLVKFAQSRGATWSDINTQLEYFKHEVDTTANGKMLDDAGFDSASLSVEEATIAFEAGFERAGKPVMGERINYANQFADNYDGTYVSGGTGASCVIGSIGSGAVNTSDAVQLAISISWPERSQSYNKAGQAWGKSAAKPEYITAKEQAMSEHGADPMRDLYSSCDRFVATIVKLTMDPQIPWGSTSEQFSYLKNSPKWEEYPTKSKQYAQPGDVWVTPRGSGAGHIVMYIGNHEGRDTIAHASYMTRTGALDYASYINNNMSDNIGRSYTGFRYIGD